MARPALAAQRPARDPYSETWYHQGVQHGSLRHPSVASRPQPDLLEALASARVRLTAPRRRVVETIGLRTGHFTAAELLDAGTAAAGRATVFRTLDLLVGLGLIERLDLRDGTHAYVRCEPRHHHHVVCDVCGRAAEVGDCGMGEVAATVARLTGYRIDGHRLELHGRCPACREAGR